MEIKEYIELLKWHTDCSHKQTTVFQVVTLGVIVGLLNGQDHLKAISCWTKAAFLVTYVVVCIAIACMAFGNYYYHNRLLDAAKTGGIKGLENGFPRYNIALLAILNTIMFVFCALTIAGFLFVAKA